MPLNCPDFLKMMNIFTKEQKKSFEITNTFFGKEIYSKMSNVISDMVFFLQSFQPIPSTPTLTKDSLDRSNDGVYESTTAVVRSVMSLSQKAPSTRSDELVDLIKVGFVMIFEFSYPCRRTIVENVRFVVFIWS